MDKWLHRTSSVEQPWVRVCFVSSFLSGLEASFFFLQCPEIFHLFLLLLFLFIAHFLLVENTYKTPYSLKAVKRVYILKIRSNY
jgi:hypothetical protein